LTPAAARAIIDIGQDSQEDPSDAKTDIKEVTDSVALDVLFEGTTTETKRTIPDTYWLQR